MSSVSGWLPKRLTDLADYINGYAFKPEDWGKDGLPIIRIEQLKNPLASTDFFSGKIPEKLVIQNGDLLFSWSASLFLKIWQHGTAALNQHLFKVVEKEGVDRFFLKAFIEFFLPELTAASHGSTMKHITRKELERFSALFPASLDEQKKIAQILLTVDQAIEQTEALIAKQQRIKTGLMQDLLTRGIDEHGQLRTEQTHAFKDSPLGRIPVEWGVQILESVSEFVTSGSRGWAQYYSTEGALFLRIGNLTRKHINMRFDDVIRVSPPASSEGERTAVKKDDLLISITADLGIVAVIPDGFETAYVNQHIALTRLDNSRAYARFVGWFLNGQLGQAQFDKLNESGAKAGLNLPSIKNLQIPVPSLDEQVKIAQAIDSATGKTDEFHARLVKCQSLKRALMQDLLTGRKRVTDLLSPEVSA
jgi:type I restriction enzyme, S subunit